MALVDSLLSAALGGVIGTGGTLLAWRTQAREARRVRLEQYEREDRFRLHKERIEAYSAFYIAAGHARRSLTSHPTGEVAADTRSDVWHAYTRVLLVGDRAVLDIAGEILSYVTAVVFDGAAFELDDYRVLIRRLQGATRADINSSDLLLSRVPSTHPPESRHGRSALARRLDP